MNKKESVMAIIKGLIGKGFSGKLGNQVVFRNYKDKTVVASVPRRSMAKLTAVQLEIRNRFRRAALYAKSALEDHELRAGYVAKARKGKSAYNIAFKDVYYPPEVSQIYTKRYTGQVNDVIEVTARDDFKVTRVWLRIFSREGVLIEEGEAKPGKFGMTWNYLATVVNPQVEGSTIEAIASDLPGNQGVLVVIVNV